MEDCHNVVTFMLHRPCREMDPEASCCQNKYELCKHGFPKDYAPENRFKEDD